MPSNKMDMPKASYRMVGGVVALAAVGYVATLISPASAAPKQETPFATPPGITFIEAGASAGMGDRGLNYMKKSSAFSYANNAGMVLYTSDKDTQAGKSNCDAECVKTWVPVVAPANAKPMGNWSVARGVTGVQQWAFKGKPLYTYVRDDKAGEGKGTSEDGGAWHTVSLDPTDGVKTPMGILVRDVEDATGLSLTDLKGMPLYFLEGKVSKAQPLSADWVPVRAAMISNPVGDFSLVRMDDGTEQWAYKGKRLYTFVSDARAGDAKGAGVDSRLQVALLARYFMPEEVAIRRITSRGSVLANKTTGTVLYRLDPYRATVGGHYARSTNGGSPAAGRALGVRECDEECTKTWPPLVAPAGAQAQDYWTILTRPDGTKQWAYKGYAMYNFTGDRDPNDMRGDNTFIYKITTVANAINDPRLPVSAVYWRVVYP